MSYGVRSEGVATPGSCGRAAPLQILPTPVQHAPIAQCRTIPKRVRALILTHNRDLPPPKKGQRGGHQPTQSNPQMKLLCAPSILFLATLNFFASPRVPSKPRPPILKRLCTSSVPLYVSLQTPPEELRKSCKLPQTPRVARVPSSCITRHGRLR